MRLKMRRFIAFPLSIAAILAACDSSSTSPDSYIKGDQIYERHLDRSMANMKCFVYATDYSVSLDLNISMLSDESYMNMQLEINANKPTTYRGKSEVAGLLLNQKDKMCNTMKDLAENMDNGTYNCSGETATFSATLPDVDESQKSILVSRLKETMKSQCDTWYDETSAKFDETEQEIANQNGNQGNSNSTSSEKAQSCNVVANGNTVQVSVIYPNKTATTTLTKNNNDYTIMETYTGIEETTLARVCETYKKETDIKNIVCSGPTISYQSNLSADETYEIEDYVAFYQQEICPAMQNGTMTLEEMWFDD